MSTVRAAGAPHPFAVSADLVGSLLGLEGTRSPAGDGGEVTLMLPGHASKPVPSPGARVAAATRPTRAAAHLRPWLVPVVRLPAQAALEVLLRGWPCPDGTEDDRAVIVGGTWDWFAAVADTAVELVAHGRALPAIVGSADGQTEARWMPAPAAADEARLGVSSGASPRCAGRRRPRRGTDHRRPPRRS